jgi:thimet oligopeptidase
MRTLRHLLLTLGGALALFASSAQAQIDKTADDYTAWFDWADRKISEIVEVPDDERTFENTLGALDDIYGRLAGELTFPQVLALLSPHAADRDVGNAVEAALNVWGIDTAKRVDLYRAIKVYADSEPELTGERALLLSNTLRDYRRSGMDLSPAERGKLKGIQKELSEASIEFNKNAQMDETTVLLTPEELPGLSAEFLEEIAMVAEVYAIPLDNYTTSEIWRLCTDETTRMKVWIAYKRKGGLQNARVLERMLELRAQAAQLLGYQHSADFQTEVLMTKNAATVKAFYDKIIPLVRKKSEADFAELLELKRTDTGEAQAEFEAWDYWYYENLARKQKYAVDMEVIRQYFPLQPAMDGLFGICKTLYGFEMRDATADARAEGIYFWHDDLKFWRVYDVESKDMIGELFTDMHPRPFKRGGAFFWDFIPRHVWMDGTETKMRGVLQCNFTKPSAGKPALLTHDEVTTLFHEFGHFVHGVLKEAETSGCAECERDFVELPSQIFENWCWEPHVLRLYARHYETGEVLPDELLEGMIAARRFASGMLAERQYYYGLSDQTYNLIQPGEAIDTTQVGIDLETRIERYDGVPGTYFQSNFTHLTNYIASYYGYQWSLVYACACFEKYKELGMLNREAGRHFVDTILSRGGLVDGMQMVRDFIGGEPTMDAYLRYLGLEE